MQVPLFWILNSESRTLAALMPRPLKVALITLCLALVLGLSLVGCLQRKLLYFPSHYPSAEIAKEHGVTPWYVDGHYTGYARVVQNPARVWLFTHGNGGQAVNRSYAFRAFNPDDAIYILEYPGYGDREGKVSKESFNAAALEAYKALLAQHGASKLCVLGESLGSGPASFLASAPTPPTRIALVVPFDVLTKVAQEKFPFLPVGLLMLDRWNNIEALKNYKGRLDIFGAKHDQVIPVEHARNLARSLPGSNYHEFDGDHGWANGNQVSLRD